MVPAIFFGKSFIHFPEPLTDQLKIYENVVEDWLRDDWQVRVADVNIYEVPWSAQAIAAMQGVVD